MNRLKRAFMRANWFTLLIISVLVILPFAQLPFVLGGSSGSSGSGGIEFYQEGDDIASLRTENSKTYSLGKGEYRIEISSGIIHYKDNYANSTEPWKDINLEKWDGEYLDTTPYILRVDKKEVSFTDKRTGETTTLKLLNVKPKELEDTFQIIPFNAGVSFQFEVLVGTDFRVKFKITGNATLITRAYDDAGEISLNVTLDEKTGELTESLDASKGKVKDKVTGEGRDVKGKIKVDPTLPISSSSKDNYIFEYAPTTNYGTLNTIYVGRPYLTYADRGLVEFTIPPYLYGATVDSATMSLYYYYSVGSFSGKTLNAHRLLRLDWSETTSTWNSYKTGSAWTTAGAASVGNDIYGSDIATATVNSGSYGWVSWGGTNMKNQAKTALAASTNVAVRIADNTETTGHLVGFYSREGTYPPKLSIDYTVNAPTLTTSACTNIKPTKVDGNGAITKPGGAYATRRGFCYIEGTAVGWVSPTGASGWGDSYKAYDNNEATYAYSLTPTSDYLILTHAEMICDKVRIKAADYGDWPPAESNPDLAIEVYYDGAWDNIWSGPIEMGWVEKSIGSLEFVTQARIKFNSTIGEGRIYEFDFNLADPTVDCDVVYEDGTFGVEAYSLTIEGLELGTSYLVRAYGNNTGGIGYGSTVAVTTLANPWPPEVDTDACDEITATSMQGNADITYDGGENAIRRGFTYAEGLKYALDFNGVSDYVEILYDANLYSSTWTYETWINRQVDHATNEYLLSYSSGATYDRVLKIQPDGTVLSGFVATAGATETLRPNAAGDETGIGIQYPASTYHYDKVDEVVADDAATYVRASISTEQRDLYNLPAHSDSGTINKVTVYFRVYHTSGGFTSQSVSVKTHGTVYDYPYSSGGSVWETFGKELATNPQTGLAWTWSEIDSLQIGCKIHSHTGSYYARCTQVYTVVDYTPTSVATTDTIPLDTETHLATTFDGTYIKVYINGILEATSANLAAYTPRDNNLPVRIGRLLTEYNFEGTEDDIRVWNTARTQTEIQANMYSELAGNETGLVGYWKLNEGTGTTAQDSTSYNNDGTITGADWVYQGWDFQDSLFNCYSPTDDGDFCAFSFVDYLTIWDAATDDVDDTSNLLGAGQLKNVGAAWELFRSFLFFDTSSIPSDAVIVDASIHFYGNADWSTTDFLITVQDGQPTYPHNPMEDGDYARTHYSGDGGSLSTSGFTTSGYNTLNLNSDGKSWINKGGQTKLCLRSDREIAGTPPTEGVLEFVFIYSSDESGTSKDPYLIVTYLTPTQYEDGNFGEGAYSLTVDDLTPSTWYRARGFAENSGGIGYGDVVAAQTLVAGHPYSWGYILGA